MEEKDCKVNRVLNIFEKLVSSEIVNKKQLADEFKVNEKTIQRDIDDIRAYLLDKEDNYNSQIKYSRKKRGYLIEKDQEQNLNSKDILAIIKIILESRAFNKDEMNHIVNSMLNQSNLEKKKQIKELIGNELFNFVPLQHGTNLLSSIWELSDIIRHKEIIKIFYSKANDKEVERIIQPIAIIFSEYYFYLIAYFNDLEFNDPVIFRIDRIKSFEKIGEKYYIADKNRFEDGEFRKRIQFMYQGELIKIKFEFYGISIEPILDRLPTAKIIKKSEDKYLIEAEVFGKGIIMWILSQGSNIKVVHPKELKEEIQVKIEKLRNIYT